MKLTHNTSHLTLYKDAPTWDKKAAYCVGEISFDTRTDGCALLEQAKDIARQDSVTRLLGPMNGDTWHTYRVVLESDGSPAFFLEPTSGPFDLDAFKDAGFEILDTYTSAKAPLLEAQTTPNSSPADITPLDLSDTAALGVVYDITRKAFTQNRFYKPLGAQDFLALYAPLLPMLDTDFLLLASVEGTPVGYLFGMPDPKQPGTIILKTYASLRYGVGHQLAYEFHKRALDKGFDTVIHALMHETNISKSRSAQHNAQTFRRYALMGCQV